MVTFFLNCDSVDYSRSVTGNKISAYVMLYTPLLDAMLKIKCSNYLTKFKKNLL